MKHKFKAFFRTLTLIFAAIITTISSGSAFAKLDLTKLKFFADNNIIYYDPSYCPDSSSYKNSKPSGDQITWVGDSYSVGADAKIKAKLPGVDIHAQGSKHFAMDAEGNPSGLSILKDMKKDNGAIRKYVVFALGTNDGNLKTSDGKDGIEELESILGSDRTIILVTPRTMVKDYADVIKEMKEGAKTYSNIIIADWAEAINEDPSQYFSSDNVHPNDKGYDKWVDVIYNALPGGVGLLAGNTNEERVWNFFASAGIAGFSDNAAAIAGVMGNLYQESTLNPFSHKSGSIYYGIYQTDNAELLKQISDAGLDQYWGRSDAPEDAVLQALQIELTFLTTKNTRFATANYSFLKNLDAPSEKSPEGFSDLFLIAVEGAYEAAKDRPHYTPANYIADAGVRAYANRYWSSVPHNDYYQEAENRRGFAREIYDKYASNVQNNTPSTPNNNTPDDTSTGVQWDANGWLQTDSFPGSAIEKASDNAPSETHNPAVFNTSDGKPNKILLHNTEGTGSGIGAYPANNRFPAHFTIDVKNKKVSQHYSLQEPSTAIKSHDKDGPIQIEIVGWSSAGHESSPYYLPNFTAEEWDYLALLLTAIAEQTQIPLTSSVSWTPGTPRLSANAFKSYTGILGHMHAPNNDHVDPGDIWQYVSAALARNPSAGKFTTGGNNTAGICPDTGSSSGSGQLVSGGMTLEQAQEFMKDYINLATEVGKDGAGSNVMHTFSDGSKAQIYHANCSGGSLANCSSFSQYFVNRYTSAGPSIAAWNGSVFVQNLLALNKGFVDGGTTPKVYAVFSTAAGSVIDGVVYGHTGVVLGIDKDNDKIIIGEAGCSRPISWIGAHEYSLSEYSNGSYNYAYTDDIINLK